ncbi:MAG: DedA family protein [Tranquillimonas sp.]
MQYLGLHADALILAYGYWAVMIAVGLESAGLPVPGETFLVAAAIYAGHSQTLSIALVILAAAAGAILGDNLGFWLGRRFGMPLLLRRGPGLGLTVPRLKLGRYLFRLYGGRVVFWGRFVALLRALAALLAGANMMPWRRFLAFNAAGGIVWATTFGLGGYLLGQSIRAVSGPVGIALLALAALGAVAGWLILRRREAEWIRRAEAEMPGPLD